MKKKIIIFVVSVIVVVVFFGSFLLARVPRVEIKNFGVTFSKIYAEELGLDWKKAYLSIFKDLKITKIRIPVYWPEVESEEGRFDFSSIDWMLEVGEQYNAEIILAVGRKLPRWPECHQPEWLKNYELGIKNQELLDYIKATVKRYDDREIVWAWQVENEPFLNFGECENYDKYFVDEEIFLARSLTDKPIIVTDGGEFGDWIRAYERADIFGSTMYRHIYDKRVGEFTYPLPSLFFRLKRGLVELFYDKKPSFVIELQSEPWGSVSITEMNLEKQYELFGPERFNDMMKYIKGSGFDTFYFWGIEWWYMLKEQGYPEMWELALDVIKNKD